MLRSNANSASSGSPMNCATVPKLLSDGPNGRLDVRNAPLFGRRRVHHAGLRTRATRSRADVGPPNEARGLADPSRHRAQRWPSGARRGFDRVPSRTDSPPAMHALLALGRCLANHVPQPCGTNDLQRGAVRAQAPDGRRARATLRSQDDPVLSRDEVRHGTPSCRGRFRPRATLDELGARRFGFARKARPDVATPATLQVHAPIHHVPHRVRRDRRASTNAQSPVTLDVLPRDSEALEVADPHGRPSVLREVTVPSPFDHLARHDSARPPVRDFPRLAARRTTDPNDDARLVLQAC